MSDLEPRRLGQRLFDACISIAVAAAALYSAVWLIRQIWVWLASALVLASLTWLIVWWRSKW